MTYEETIQKYSNIKLDFSNLSETDPALIGPSSSSILRALTLTSASDGFNLDRVEMLGDSFLKFSYSIYVYCKYPFANEGHLSALRSYQVANLNLYEIGSFIGLPECILGSLFEVDRTANTWMPPLYWFVGRYSSEFVNVRVGTISRNLEIIQSDPSIFLFTYWRVTIFYSHNI